jgi:hypothetical protein
MSRSSFHRRNAVHDLALMLVLRVHALPVDGFPGHAGRTPRRPRDLRRDHDASRYDHRGLANRHRAPDARRPRTATRAGSGVRDRLDRGDRSSARRFDPLRPQLLRSDPRYALPEVLRRVARNRPHDTVRERTRRPTREFFGDRVPHDSPRTGSCGSLRRRLRSRPFRRLGLHLSDWLANCGQSQTATQPLLQSLQKTGTRYCASNTSSPPRMPIASPHRRGHRSRKQSAFAP